MTTSSQTQAGRLPRCVGANREGRQIRHRRQSFRRWRRREINAFGTRAQEPAKYPAGTVAELDDGVTLQVNADGSFVMTSPKAFEGDARPARLSSPRRRRRNSPRRTTNSAVFRRHRAFLHQLADGDDPRHDHPDPDRRLRRLRARLDALSGPRIADCGDHRPAGRAAADVADPAAANSTTASARSSGCRPRPISASGWRIPASGCPSRSICCASYIAGLPREIMESARIDGASDFEIFVKIVLPLSFPVLASFAIFQFLWVWNDLLVAMVFLRTDADQLVLTGRSSTTCSARAAATGRSSRPRPLSRSSCRWSSSSRCSAIFVRGLLAGSVKGG